MSVQIEAASRFPLLHRVILGWSPQSHYYGSVELAEDSNAIVDCVTSALTPDALVRKLGIYLAHPDRTFEEIRKMVSRRGLLGSILPTGQPAVPAAQVAAALDEALVHWPRMNPSLRYFLSQAASHLRRPA